ncbi:MAG: trypsin-like serine protease [Planctomycetota bacterium]
MRTLHVFLFAISTLVPVASLAAQSAPSQPRAHAPLAVVGYVQAHDQTLSASRSPLGVSVAAAETIVFGHGSSVRLHFDRSELSKGSVLEIASLLDGATERLCPKDFVGGCASSAYFNGPAVRLQLIAGPGATASSVHVCRLAVGGGSWTPTSICGLSDDRLPAQHNAVCRMVIELGSTIGVCTGWLVNTSNGIATAGHCLDMPDLTGMVAEFNVPLSNADGSLVHPPAEHQYTYSPGTARFVNGGVGNDFGVFRVGPKFRIFPYARQGTRFTLAAPQKNVSCTRAGCGSADGVRNFALEAAIGDIDRVVGDEVRYRIDSSGGDSGGPVFRNGTVAVAVHTHSSCTVLFGTAFGTSAAHPTFASFVADLQ